MLAPKNVDKLLKDIQKETGLSCHWHSTVIEPLPIGIAHKIVCELPVRGRGTQYIWFYVLDDLLFYMNDDIIRYLKDEIDKARKGE